MRSLVVGEWEDGAIADATLRVIQAASGRGLPVDVLTFSPAMANAAACVDGVGRVLLASDDMPNPETLSNLLQHIASITFNCSESPNNGMRGPSRRCVQQCVSRGHHARGDSSALRARSYAGSGRDSLRMSATLQLSERLRVMPASATGGAALIVALGYIALFTATVLTIGRPLRKVDTICRADCGRRRSGTGIEGKHGQARPARWSLNMGAASRFARGGGCRLCAQRGPGRANGQDSMPGYLSRVWHMARSSIWPA